ncbi:MAG TPA: glycoside hydrolase family 127 protein, partial [Saprospiraceae bacterium]|nr:glycoside hydrolase family 127 protein [Saprospiraceae bacterium]
MSLTFKVWFFILCAIPLCGQKFKDYPYQPVDFTQVKVNDQFWAPKIKTNAEVSIPHTLQQCKDQGRIDNFYRAAHILQDDKSTSYTFDDSDLFKVIEGASYSLQVAYNQDLDQYIDTLISIIAAAQEEDGYLFTFRTMNTTKKHEWMGQKRWEKVEDLSHELYNLGHLYEAAAAHFKATGKRTFLDIALKSANLLVNTFGWGKEEKFPGHQIIETGLVKLYRITNNKEYLDLAKFFLDLRGTEGHFNQKYSQSHLKVIDQHTAEGHAVRATYMYSGMADVAAITGNKDYQIAIDNIWNDVTQRKMYITGGIGSTNHGEAFGGDYDLPNMTAYAETCAAIASVYWNMRMFSLHGHAKYIDILERTLYNGLLSGVSLSGDHFFYPNPLASIGQHQRSPWHNCACCVTNMTRFMPSVPGYVYAQKDDQLFINLFMGSSAKIRLSSTEVEVIQKTNYPWDGTNIITVNPQKNSSKFSIQIRIPGWALDDAVPGDLYSYQNAISKNIPILVNGKKVPYKMVNGFAQIERKWSKGDQIIIALDMKVRKVLSNTQVKTNLNRIALERGPLVYCLEGTDNVDQAVLNLVIDTSADVTAEFNPNLLQGVAVLKTKARSY